MEILDSLSLGFLADEIDNSSETQSEVSERNLYLYNQESLAKAVDKRVSKFSLDFLLEKLIGSNDEFWSLIFNRLIKVYSLNALKVFIPSSYENPDKRSKEEVVISLIKFIKLNLISKIEDGSINSNISRDEIERLFDEMKAPIDMIWFIKLTDNESLDAFISQIFKESKMEYDEI